jgi:RNA:NAD 2'-phosphotransferase (TPT1/KptA family)
MTLRHPLRDRHLKRKKGNTAQLAAQLAPLEEQDRQAARRQGANGNGSRLIQEQGALIVDTNHLHLPSELTEAGGSKMWEVEPVVLVIIGAILLFIAFIAWQISLMPAVG